MNNVTINTIKRMANKMVNALTSSQGPTTGVTVLSNGIKITYSQGAFVCLKTVLNAELIPVYIELLYSEGEFVQDVRLHPGDKGEVSMLLNEAYMSVAPYTG